MLKIINSRNSNLRNISGIQKSNTILNNKENIKNTLFNNYRNNSCNLRNKNRDNNMKSNLFYSLSKNYYKTKNNMSSINKNNNNNTIKRDKNSQNKRNEFVTINNNYYTIINNTTVNNININGSISEIKFENNNNDFKINNNKEILDKIEKELRGKIAIKNSDSKITKDNENKTHINKIKIKKPIYSLNMPTNCNNLITKNNYSIHFKNKKSIDENNKDIFDISINNKKSRNKSSFKNEFITNSNFHNISLRKENKMNFVNYSTYKGKKNSSKKKLNLSYINKRRNIDLSNKKRTIKIKNNNDKLSLKQKIHLFHQRKDELLKQYSNKNKVVNKKTKNEKK